MKPLRVIAATLLCQSILLSPTAMAQKERSDEKPDKEERAEGRKGKTGAAVKRDAPAKKEQAKQNPQKRAAENKQAANKPDSEKKRTAPKQAAKNNDGPAKKKANAAANPERNKAQEKPAKKPTERPANRPNGGQKEVAGKREDAREKGGGKQGNPDRKPMDIPGKRAESGKKEVAKQNGSERREETNGRPAAKQDVARGGAKNSAKQAKRMELPGKRPQVSAARQTARAERLQKDVNKRQAERRVAEGRQNQNTRERREKVVRAGQNSRAVRRPDVQKNTQNNWWNTNNRVTNNDVRVRNTTINNTTVINRNFERNVNWTTRERDWGYNPWWNRPQTRPWYGSSWNGSWNRSYYSSSYYRGYNHGYHDGYRPPGYSTVSVGAAIGWGLIGWSLGTMVYDTGYQRYHNPYPVSVPVSYGSSRIDYTQPITRVAVQTAPEDSSVLVENTQRSETIIGESQSAFKERNYLVALELADKAIAESPGDGALHEYRALVLFALGKYGDSAGVLNPVLASGPGWDWSTMIALYDSQQTYTDQLQRLETYSEQNPDSADTHFLLGYHYMVCGHTDLATPQFDTAAKLMPSDSVSRQLAELTSASADPDSEEATPPAEEEIENLPDPEPVPLEKLTGTWTSKRDDGSTVTLQLGDDGKFTWNYAHDGESSGFSGDYSMNDDGLLVLDSEDSQMVATVALPQDQEMNFVLAGGPPEDPGLAFKKG
ncbi:MAG: hypothetical protein V4640_00605 [Verrucomicrobiota bacterium]